MLRRRGRQRSRPRCRRMIDGCARETPFRFLRRRVGEPTDRRPREELLFVASPLNMDRKDGGHRFGGRVRGSLLGGRGPGRRERSGGSRASRSRCSGPPPSPGDCAGRQTPHASQDDSEADIAITSLIGFICRHRKLAVGVTSGGAALATAERLPSREKPKLKKWNQLDASLHRDRPSRLAAQTSRNEPHAVRQHRAPERPTLALQ